MQNDTGGLIQCYGGTLSLAIFEHNINENQ